jgi:hypothetical protein
MEILQFKHASFIPCTQKLYKRKFSVYMRSFRPVLDNVCALMRVSVHPAGTCTIGMKYCVVPTSLSGANTRLGETAARQNGREDKAAGSERNMRTYFHVFVVYLTTLSTTMTI